MGIISKYSPLLLRKIHPDFFPRSSKEQFTNQKSLQSLNTIISLLKSSCTHPEQPLFFDNTCLMFYWKPNDSLMMDIASVEFTKLSPKINHGKWKVENLTRFLDLCGDVGILVNPEDYPFRKVDDQDNLQNNNIDFPKELKYFMLGNDGKDGKDGVDGGKGDEAEFTLTLKMLRNNRLIFYTKDLSLEERAQALVLLAENINFLQYHKWKHFPVLISREYRVNDTFLVFPFNFDPAQLVIHIKKYCSF